MQFILVFTLFAEWQVSGPNPTRNEIFDRGQPLSGREIVAEFLSLCVHWKPSIPHTLPRQGLLLRIVRKTSEFAVTCRYFLEDPGQGCCGDVQNRETVVDQFSGAGSSMFEIKQIKGSFGENFIIISINHFLFYLSY